MSLERITENFVLERLPKREPTAHKGDFGRILLVCGSVGYTGAAALAAMAAVRTGAGLCFVGVPEPVYPIVAGKLLEPMVFPLPASDGMLSADIAALSRRLTGMDAVAFGPGLGKGNGVFSNACAVLSQQDVPVVLDADGINVFSGHIDLLRKHACPLVITPHPGEFSGISKALSRKSREDAAAEVASELNCVCVLKGNETVVTDGTRLLVNTTGNPGMATGGSGDVLTGMITALIGMGLPPLDAAACGVWLHGRAGDLCAVELGEYGMLPSDMIGVLPRILP